MMYTLFRVAACCLLLLLAACGSVPTDGVVPVVMQESPVTATTRPRLYLDRAKIGFLRARLNEEPYRVFWQDVRNKINDFRARPLPVNVSGLNDGNIREFGDRLPYLALAWLLTGDPDYIADAVSLMDGLSAMRSWASNRDIGAAHLLFGMAVAYDWLYSELNEEQKQRYRQRMVRQAKIFQRLLETQGAWWTKTYLQNHNYTNAMSLAVTGVALLGEEEETRSWLDVTARNFDRVQQLLSPDGASHEGVGYWGYGVESLLKYYLGSERLYGPERLRDSAYFRNAVEYRLHMSLPGFHENADYADSPRYEWLGPGFILRAHTRLYRDGLGNWLARKIESARDPQADWWLPRPKYSWLDLVLFDASAGYRTPKEQPVSAAFENAGIYVLRDAWENGRFWSLFKAGPSQGEAAYRRGHYAGGHIHPDSGHYSIWWRGRWLVQDDGRIRIRRTHNHNVLLFNGAGQLGEGESRFLRGEMLNHAAASRIVYRDTQPGYQYVTAEMAGVYPENTGLQRWLRTYVSIAEGIVVIRDDILSDRPVSVESFIHLSDKPQPLPYGSLCLDQESGYSLYPVLPGDWSMQLNTYQIPVEEQQGRGATVAGILVTQQGRVQKAATILNIYAPGQPGCQAGPGPVGSANLNGVSIRTADNRQYRIDFTRRSVTSMHRSSGSGQAE